MYSIDYYYNITNRIKCKHKRTYTNIFFDNISIEKMLSDERTKINGNDDFMIIIQQEDDFSRIFFTVGCDVDLANFFAKILFRDDTYVLEIVGRERGMEQLVSSLETASWEKYAVLNRWRTNAILLYPPRKCEASLKIATQCNTDVIMELMNHTFDKYISHLPTKSYLQHLIRKGLVFLAEVNKEIVGIICLETIGDHGKYLYQIMSDKKYREMGIAEELAKYAFGHYSEDTIFTSWVDCKNIASCSLHNKLGFKPDGLATWVFLNKRK